MAICEPPTTTVAHEVAQIVRNWPDELWMARDWRKEEEGQYRYCAIGALLETGGCDWNDDFRTYGTILRFLRRRFGLTIEVESFFEVIRANDDHGKLAAADVIEREWR